MELNEAVLSRIVHTDSKTYNQTFRPFTFAFWYSTVTYYPVEEYTTHIMLWRHDKSVWAHALLPENDSANWGLVHGVTTRWEYPNRWTRIKRVHWTAAVEMHHMTVDSGSRMISFNLSCISVCTNCAYSTQDLPNYTVTAQWKIVIPKWL